MTANCEHCQRCGGEMDAATGRHLDDEGQVMDFREDLIQCRPAPDPRQAELLKQILAERGIAPPTVRVRYVGYDIVEEQTS